MTAAPFHPVNRVARAITDAVARRGPAVPRRRDEYSARLAEPWHVRTLIVPMPGEGAVELLFANLISGRVGVAGFDDEPPADPSVAPRDESHLALLVLGRGAAIAETLAFSRREHVRATEGGLRVEVPGSFTYEVRGRWPDYTQSIRVPSRELDVELRVRCAPPVRWWAYAPRAYVHHSAFGAAAGSVALAGTRTVVDHPASLEPASGQNLLRLPRAPSLPATLFHYQLGTLPGVASWAIGCPSG